MRKVLRSACLLLSTLVLTGCGTGRGSAHYGWLRLKGDPKPAATAEYQAPADPGPAILAGDEPVAEIDRRAAAPEHGAHGGPPPSPDPTGA
ncbi:MAG: hypothetical protein QM724_00510 [Flavobacteriales bacterium]